PYAPFAEVLESLAGAVPADELRADLGTGGPALAQLVPTLREAVPGMPGAARRGTVPPPRGDGAAPRGPGSADAGAALPRRPALGRHVDRGHASPRCP